MNDDLTAPVIEEPAVERVRAVDAEGGLAVTIQGTEWTGIGPEHRFHAALEAWKAAGGVIEPFDEENEGNRYRITAARYHLSTCGFGLTGALATKAAVLASGLPPCAHCLPDGIAKEEGS